MQPNEPHSHPAVAKRQAPRNDDDVGPVATGIASPEQRAKAPCKIVSGDWSTRDRPLAPGSIAAQGTSALRPCLENRLHDAPGLLGFVVPDRKRVIAAEHVEQQPSVRRNGGRIEIGVELGRPDLERRSAGREVDMQRQPSGAQGDPQAIGVRRGAVVEHALVHRLERHQNFVPVLGQGFAAAQPERHAGPSMVVDVQRDLRKRLCAARRVVGPLASSILSTVFLIYG